MTKTKAIRINLPVDLHRRLKRLAADREDTMQNLAIDTLAVMVAENEALIGLPSTPSEALGYGSGERKDTPR